MWVCSRRWHVKAARGSDDVLCARVGRRAGASLERLSAATEASAATRMVRAGGGVVYELAAQGRGCFGERRIDVADR